jgi:hypothetical protein
VTEPFCTALPTRVSMRQWWNPCMLGAYMVSKPTRPWPKWAKAFACVVAAMSTTPRTAWRARGSTRLSHAVIFRPSRNMRCGCCISVHATRARRVHTPTTSNLRLCYDAVLLSGGCGSEQQEQLGMLGRARSACEHSRVLTTTSISADCQWSSD